MIKTSLRDESFKLETWNGGEWIYKKKKKNSNYY